MRPSRPLRLVARDRLQRDPVKSATVAHIHRVKPKPPRQLEAPQTLPSPAGQDLVARPGRPRAARIVLIGMMAAVAVNFGAVLGVISWNVAQAFGWIEEPAIEAAQRQQAASISQLDANVIALNAAMEGLIARTDFAGERETANSRRIGELESTLGGLRSSINEMRGSQGARTSDDSRQDPEVTGSMVPSGEAMRPRSADDLSAIGARIDRIERAMTQHHLLGPIRGTIQEPGSRALALRARPAPAPAPMPGDGHIITLTPPRP